MKNLIRTWLGHFLLCKALDLLPASDSDRQGLLRGWREQRAYDRYQAYCRLLGTIEVSFSAWRQMTETMRAKAEAEERSNAVLKMRRRVRRAA